VNDGTPELDAFPAYARENRPWGNRHPRARKALRIASRTVIVLLAILGAVAMFLWWLLLFTGG
jgi:hypothetical protein